MVDKQIVHKLALERCRVHVSHLCALTHLAGEFEEKDSCIRDSLNMIFEHLNRDLSLMEDIGVE